MTRARTPARGDLYHERSTHLWLAPPVDRRARCGLDPLEAEASGDIVAVSLFSEGRRLARGESFGSLEAAKFVGPLLAPVSGVIRARNLEVVRHPGLINRAPYDAWLVELELDDESQLAALLHGEDEVRQWFELERARLEQSGAIAP